MEELIWNVDLVNDAATATASAVGSSIYNTSFLIDTKCQTLNFCD